MKHPLILGAVLATFGFAGSAEASCFFTPAICQAICNKDCCDDLAIERPADQGRLNKIGIQALTAEYNQAEKRGWKGDYMRILKAEIDRR